MRKEERTRMIDEIIDALVAYGIVSLTDEGGAEE